MGFLGLKFKCKRGKWQGDLLSPLLFVLAAHLLQSLLNKAWHEGYLHIPINQPASEDYLVIQCANDTLILPVESSKLLTARQLFDSNAG